MDMYIQLKSMEVLLYACLERGNHTPSCENSDRVKLNCRIVISKSEENVSKSWESMRGMKNHVCNWNTLIGEEMHFLVWMAWYSQVWPISRSSHPMKAGSGKSSVQSGTTEARSWRIREFKYCITPSTCTSISWEIKALRDVTCSGDLFVIFF